MRIALVNIFFPLKCITNQKNIKRFHKMIEDYLKHKAERQKNNLPPLSLDSKQTSESVELLKKDSIDNAEFLIDLLTEHVPAGVDQAAFVKAAFLTEWIFHHRQTHKSKNVIEPYYFAPIGICQNC